MTNRQCELFFTTYFSVSTMLLEGKYDKKQLFTTLANMYFIPNASRKGLFAKAEKESVASIRTDKDYLRYLRLRKYSQLQNIPLSEEEEQDREMITVKGSAITVIARKELMPDAEATVTGVCKKLFAEAGAGNIVAMRTLGILQCAGIFTEQNFETGSAYLTHAARWNDPESVLAALYFIPSDRDAHLSRLKAITLDGSPFACLVELAEKAYATGPVSPLREALVLEKAFSVGTIHREAYSSKYLRVITSPILPFADRERLLLSGQKEAVAVAAELPIRPKALTVESVSLPALENLPLMREKELLAIRRPLHNADLRTLSIYKPLCLVTDSAFVADMYMSAILAGNTGLHVTYIDIGELAPSDMEPTGNHCFIRGLDEEKDNILLLDFRGDITPDFMDKATDFLTAGKRENFHLVAPPLTLDLTRVLPICITNKHNSRPLSHLCQMVQLGNVSKDEMPAAIAYLLKEKSCLYRVDGITLSPDLLTAMCELDIDTLNEVLEDMVCQHREKNKQMILDMTHYTPALKAYRSRQSSGLGFGGAKQ